MQFWPNFKDTPSLKFARGFWCLVSAVGVLGGFFFMDSFGPFSLGKKQEEIH